MGGRSATLRPSKGRREKPVREPKNGPRAFNSERDADWEEALEIVGHLPGPGEGGYDTKCLALYQAALRMETVRHSLANIGEVVPCFREAANSLAEAMELLAGRCLELLETAKPIYGPPSGEG